MTEGLFLQDFVVGAKYKTASARIEAAEIKAFGSLYDPQPFHLDEAGAEASFFRGLSASGWHTASVTMRLMVQSPFHPVGGIIGTWAEEVRWPRPVRPGDELHVEAEVLEVRQSRNRPGQGYVKCRCTTLNQRGEPVFILVINLLADARP
jgi:acyl dehydratase